MPNLMLTPEEPQEKLLTPKQKNNEQEATQILFAARRVR